MCPEPPPLLTYTWRVWSVSFDSGSGFNFCCFFVSSMLSDTNRGARKIQWGIFRVCEVNNNIDGIFPMYMGNM